MGKPMAANLLKAGYPVTVHNRSQGVVEELAGAGAQRATSPAEVARNSEIVLLCLPMPADVEQIVTGKDGVLDSLASGGTIIDCSTIDPATSRNLAQTCADRGITFLDAPVSGGTTGAQAGTLTIMVGGDEETYNRVKPVLDAMGKNIFYVGPSGNGSVTKMINQLLVGVTTTAVAEAYVLGVKAGMNTELLFNVLSTGFADSRIMRRNVPDFYLKQNWQPGFAIDLLMKDVTLAAALGDENNVGTPMLDRAIEHLKTVQAAGYGALDMSGVAKYAEDEAGIKLG